MNTNLLFAVAAGGAFGAMMRYSVIIWLTRMADAPPYMATFTVNILGSFFAGCIASLVASSSLISEPMRLFLLVGLMGGLTTFSSFSLDSYIMLEKQQWGLLASYMFGSVIIGITFFAIGFWLFKMGGKLV